MRLGDGGHVRVTSLWGVMGNGVWEIGGKKRANRRDTEIKQLCDHLLVKMIGKISKNRQFAKGSNKIYPNVPHSEWYIRLRA